MKSKPKREVLVVDCKPVPGLYDDLMRRHKLFCRDENLPITFSTFVRMLLANALKTKSN